MTNTFRTRITDILDAQGIAYRLLPHREAVFTVEAAAAQRGVILAEMVKSILMCDRGDHYVMACVPGASRVDPKAVQAALGPEWRRLHFASAKEILAVTGCVQGAVSPIGLPDEVPVLFDEAIGRLARCNISSGDPLCGLELAVADLIRVARGQLARISQAAWYKYHWHPNSKEILMALHPLAGKPAPRELLVNVPRLVSAYYTDHPDPAEPAHAVAFGTSGHRGSSLSYSFNEDHILAITPGHLRVPRRPGDQPGHCSSAWTPTRCPSRR